MLRREIAVSLSNVYHIRLIEDWELREEIRTRDEEDLGKVTFSKGNNGVNL